MEKCKKALCCIVFSVSYTPYNNFEVFENISYVISIRKSESREHYQPEAEQPEAERRAGKIFPWFTFSDLDNIGKIFSHTSKLFYGVETEKTMQQNTISTQFV